MIETLNLIFTFRHFEMEKSKKTPFENAIEKLA